MKQLGPYTLTENKSFKWKKGEKVLVRSATGRERYIYHWTLVSDNHEWELAPTGEHPTFGYTQAREKPNATYWQIFKDGKAFSKTQKTAKQAKEHVESWIRRYEGTEYDK